MRISSLYSCMYLAVMKYSTFNHVSNRAILMKVDLRVENQDSRKVRCLVCALFKSCHGIWYMHIPDAHICNIRYLILI